MRGHAVDGEGGGEAVATALAPREVVFKRLPAARTAGFASAFTLLRGIACAHLSTPLGLELDADGERWIVSAFVDGAPLPRGPADVSTTLKEMCGVAEALAAVHARETHHGDVGPQNVLCDAEGRTVLIDFGSLGAYGTGTPGFIAPEVLAGGGGPPADLFGLGALWLWRLTGATPWRAPAVVASLTPARVRTVVDEAKGRASTPWPPGLADLLTELLDPRPEMRETLVGAPLLRRLRRLAAGAEDGHVAAARWIVPAHLPWHGEDLAPALAWMCDRTRPDAGTGVVVVAGPPGSGRTRAVQELVARASAASLAGARWCTPTPAGAPTQAREEPPASTASWARTWAHIERAWVSCDADAGLVACGEALACDADAVDAVAARVRTAASLARSSVTMTGKRRAAGGW